MRAPDSGPGCAVHDVARKQHFGFNLSLSFSLSSACALVVGSTRRRLNVCTVGGASRASVFFALPSFHRRGQEGHETTYGVVDESTSSFEPPTAPGPGAGLGVGTGGVAGATAGRDRLLHRLSRVPGPVRYQVPSLDRAMATVQVSCRRPVVLGCMGHGACSGLWLSDAGPPHPALTEVWGSVCP